MFISFFLFFFLFFSFFFFFFGGGGVGGGGGGLISRASSNGIKGEEGGICKMRNFVDTQQDKRRSFMG
jgi:hypothetical protein